MKHIGTRSWRHALAVSATAAALAIGTSHAWSVSTTVNSDFIETVSPTCDGAAFCRLVFTAVSADRVKIVTNVSCEVKALNTSNAQLYDSSLGRGTSVLQMPYTSLIPVVVGTFTSGTRFFKINNSAYHVFSVGQVPQVFLRMNGGTFSYAACTISGVTRSSAP